MSRNSVWVRNRFLMGALFTADEYVDAPCAQSVVRHEMSQLMRNVDFAALSPARGKTALTLEYTMIVVLGKNRRPRLCPLTQDVARARSLPASPRSA